MFIRSCQQSTTEAHLMREVNKQSPSTRSTRAQEVGRTCAPGLTAHSALRRSKSLVRTSRRTAPGVMPSSSCVTCVTREADHK